MKALRFIMMVLLMALTANFAPQAGAQTIRDANHHNIGRISPNGTVRDNDSRPIGFFDRDGVIRNKNSKQIGLIKGLQIYNNDNERIGYILNDGTVRDGESRILGYIAAGAHRPQRQNLQCRQEDYWLRTERALRVDSLLFLLPLLRLKSRTVIYKSIKRV